MPLGYAGHARMRCQAAYVIEAAFNFASIRWNNWSAAGCYNARLPVSPSVATDLLSAVPRRSFSALSNRQFVVYFSLASAAMMADNIEHVISYWVIFQKFHSSALGAFAVISHWVPFLLLAPYSGTLADRVDIRRLIQTGMLMFCGVSLGWGNHVHDRLH